MSIDIPTWHVNYVITCYSTPIVILNQSLIVLLISFLFSDEKLLGAGLTEDMRLVGGVDRDEPIDWFHIHNLDVGSRMQFELVHFYQQLWVAVIYLDDLRPISSR